jgi:DNA-binding Lrp family transcriptional regulator
MGIEARHRDTIDRQLIAILSEGLPIVSRPYEAIAATLGTSEADVVARIENLKAQEALSRFGVIVRHAEIGYRANAMVVWDVPDGRVSMLGKELAKEPCVTLCYRRPRAKDWPYNLFTMIHGTSRTQTLSRLQEMIERCELQGIDRDVLFSTRRFKQRGANYGDKMPLTSEAAAS